MKILTYKLSFLLSIIFICLFSIIFPKCVWGQDDAKKLGFVSCTLEDGSGVDAANGITLNPKFTLSFDKNIVDALVWDNNKKCVSLFDDDNTKVSIDISKIDDAVDFDHRQQIFLAPSNSLNSEKNYHIYISTDLTAKNKIATLGGTTEGKGITINFKTQKQVVSQNTSTQPAKNENNVQKNSVDASTNAKVAPINWIYIIAGAILISWIIIEFLFKRKIKESYIFNMSLANTLRATMFGTLDGLANDILHLPIHMPGHTSIWWMGILIVGKGLVGNFGSGIVMGIVSGFIAISFGMGNEGAFVFLQYLIPGLLIDLLAPFFRFKFDNVIIGGICGIFMSLSKLLASILVGLILNVPLGFLTLGLVYVSISHAIYGAIGGVLAAIIIKRLKPRLRYWG